MLVLARESEDVCVRARVLAVVAPSDRSAVVCEVLHKEVYAVSFTHVSDQSFPLINVVGQPTSD